MYYVYNAYLLIYSIYFVYFYLLPYKLFLFTKCRFIFIVFYNYYNHLLSYFQLFQIVSYFFYRFCILFFNFYNFCLFLYFQLLHSKLKIDNNIIFCLINSFKSISHPSRYKIFGIWDLAINNLSLQLEFNLVL